MLDTPGRAARVVARARSYRVDTRPYYRPLHRMPAFEHCRRGPLPVTESLADCVVGVPLYSGIRHEVVDLVAGLVADALDFGEDGPERAHGEEESPLLARVSGPG